MSIPKRTLFSYIGGKKKWMAKWSPLLPSHTLYVSVFGGSGADILFKPPSEVEVFNDLDGDINNLFRVLRTQQEELVRLVSFTPARSRQTFCEALDILHDHSASRLERAWAFLVVSHQGARTKHPVLHVHSGYAGLRQSNRCIPQWLHLPETISVVADRFRSVQLERKDFRSIIPHYDGPNTLFFLDPPYHPETRPHRYYAHEMSHEDHEELLSLLNRVQGKVWLCGYDHPLYADVLRRWRRQEFVSFSPHPTRASRTEIVWTNFVPVREAG